MTSTSSPTHQAHEYWLNDGRSSNLEVEQEKIYNFLLQIVNTWEPKDVLREFKRLFIGYFDVVTSHPSLGVYEIFSKNNEQEFYSTLKRCCYILINNWQPSKKYHPYIKELINLLEDCKNRIELNTFERTSIYLIWLNNFFHSNEYQELQLFVDQSEDISQRDWTRRYTSYLLFAQSLEEKNPKEQQEAARRLSRKLKDKFKFELAMYTAHSQCASTNINRYKNPSHLGDEVLRLIKMIVLKKGVFCHENISNIFLKQTQYQTVKEFKYSIQKYLFFSIQQQKIVNTLREHISERLYSWLVEYDEKTIDKDILLRICNRIIDSLTIKHGKEPSLLFTLLLSQGHALTLVIILLKIVLICRNSRSHVELRIANLIHYYSKYSANECSWVINFLEVFNIAFAIHTDNIQYNLIKMREKDMSENLDSEVDAYHIFCQAKK